MCVQVCGVGALIYSEKEYKIGAQEVQKLGEIEHALTSLIKRYSMDKICDSVEQLSKK